MCCPALIHSVACSAWVCLAAHLLLWGKACVAQLGPKCCLQRLGPLAAHPPLAQFGSVPSGLGTLWVRVFLAQFIPFPSALGTLWAGVFY